MESNFKMFQEVHVIKGSGLLDADWGSKSDPYFICRIGKLGSMWSEKVFEIQSQVIYENEDPEWDARFYFPHLTSSESTLELTLRIYDSDNLKIDDFLGSVTATLPAEAEKEATEYPIYPVMENKKGTVLIKFSKIEGIPPNFQNCSLTGNKENIHSHFLENMWGQIEAFEVKTTDQTDSNDEVIGPEPSSMYFKSLKRLQQKDKVLDICRELTQDGGETAPGYLEPGTTAILSHDAIMKEMETWCERWKNGEVYRSNEFGIFRLNPRLWSDINPPHHSIAMPIENHAYTRPILDKLLGKNGNWSEESFVEFFENYMDEIIESGRPLKIPEDAHYSLLRTFHKILLNTEMSQGEAMEFMKLERSVFQLMSSPDSRLDNPQVRKEVKYDEIIEFRKQKVGMIKATLSSQHHFETEEALHHVAVQIFDVLMFAGVINIGNLIWNSLTAMYSPDSELPDINEENLDLLFYECLRFYSINKSGAGREFAYCNGLGKEYTKRTILMLSSALRDQSVWGEDANEFKLRDLEQYRQVGVPCMFATPMVDKENPENNRYCPAYYLSLPMGRAWMNAFLARKDKFFLEDPSHIKIEADGPGRYASFEFKTRNEERDNIPLPSLNLDIEADYKRIQNLSVEEYSEYFSNVEDHPQFSKLDLNTKLFYKLCIQRVKAHISRVGDQGEKRMGEISLPKPPTKLVCDVAGPDSVPGMLFPNDDEDFVKEDELKEFFGGLRKAMMFSFLKSLPMDDGPYFFENDEEYTEVLNQHFLPGKIFPEPNESFDDPTSDEAIPNMAFYGMGQVLLQKSKDSNDEDIFVVDTTPLGGLKVREGFDKYGAKAVFSMDRELKHIYVCQFEKEVQPGDEEWEHAKWIWRVSLHVFVTAGPHMVHLHWIKVNSCHIAARTTLGANHPIRRVLKPFLFYSGAINLVSAIYLAQENALLHRSTGFEFRGGLDMGFRYFASNFKYETFPEKMESRGLNEENCSEIPLFTDALPIWDALHKFFTSYVDIFYVDDNAVYFDRELATFWETVDKRGDNGSPWRYGLPFMNKASLADYLTHFAFDVTAWHEIVGTFVQYVVPPYGIGLKIYPGKEQLDIQGYVQQLILAALVGLRNPLLMSNWKYLLPDHPKAKELHDELMKDLQEVSEKVDALNATAPCPSRPRKTESFNPKFLECSVSV